MKRPARRTKTKPGIAIVVGTDLSSASADALERATDIARETGATLHVVHASARLPAAFARSLGIGNDERAIGRALARSAEEICGADVPVRTHHLHGGAANALCTTSREVGAALVVVGARGRLLPDATLGSTAERVMSSAVAPVLLVRRKVTGAYRDVVIAADPETDLRAAADAAHLVAPDATPSVLHAFGAPFESTLRLQGTGAATIQSYRRHVRQEAMKTMTSLLEKVGIDTSSLVLRQGDPRVVLSRVDRRTLVVIHRSRSLVRRALVGSVSRWLIAYGTGDLLLV